MACFSPVDAWRTDHGEIVFRDRGGGRPLQIPCGQCIGCRLERSRQWAMRSVHEASLHDVNSFVTLTYAPEHCPTSLEYRDFQLFLKRARRKFGPFRFYMAGEYGSLHFRPHYHALLFGLGFPDRYPWRVSPAGFQLYRSPALESVWTEGGCEVGDVTFESAAYVARYCVAKRTGPLAEDHYRRCDVRTGEIVEVRPEFNRMSLKPGIGADWIRLYHTDVYSADGEASVWVNGMKVKPPRFYDRYVDETFMFEEVEFDRHKKGLLNREDNSPERLAVREKVTRARLAFKKRSLE